MIQDSESRRCGRRIKRSELRRNGASEKMGRARTFSSVQKVWIVYLLTSLETKEGLEVADMFSMVRKFRLHFGCRLVWLLILTCFLSISVISPNVAYLLLDQPIN